MSDHIVTLDTSTHQAVQELLPWFVTETLEGDEHALVQEHLQVCSQCQADVDWHRKLHAVGIPLPSAAPDVESALARLLPRLDAAPQMMPAARSTPIVLVRSALAEFLRNLARGDGQWMRWALAAQFALIVGLTTMLASFSGNDAAYRVLGARSSAGNVVVMFKPETSEQELRRILQANGARVVDGPTVTDAYLLSVPDAQVAGAVAALRSQHAVALVESLDNGGTH